MIVLIKIDGEKTPWRFVEKEDDRICTVKNTKTGEYYKGVIDSLTSSGRYQVELKKKIDS